MSDHETTPCVEDQQLERVRYFAGQLLTEADFVDEQSYVLAKDRRHNRLLHGSGVVCGLAVEATSPPSDQVVVQPGVAIDGRGREIVLEAPATIDVAKQVGAAEKSRLFVTVAYDELEVVPEPSPQNGDLEASRVRETVRFGVTADPPELPERPTAVGPCPPCHDSRVTLAAIDLAPVGPITADRIDCGVRRAVGSPHRVRERGRTSPMVAWIAGVAAFAIGWLLRSRRG